MHNALPRDRNLDFIRALAIFLIILWHFQPIKILSTPEWDLFLRVLAFCLTQFYLQFTLLAVPLLFLVSLYLFFQNFEARPLAYLKKRLLRLGSLYLFWTTCQFAFSYLSYYAAIRILTGQKNLSGFSINLTVPFHRLLIEGGPPLAHVGGSVFYFLFILLILVLISAAFYALRNAKRIFSAIGIIVVITSILYFEFLNYNDRGLIHYRIDNYLIYVPLSYFLWRQAREQIRRILPLLFLGYIFFSVWDFFLRQNGISVNPSYSRASIVFGSITVFGFILQLKLRDLKEFSMVSFISRYSLGIYATHKYWYFMVTYALIYYGVKHPVFIANFPIDLKDLLISALSILLTIFAVGLAGRTVMRRLVS